MPQFFVEYLQSCRLIVSIRRTTGFEPFYTPIATVTINLIAAVAIVLSNLYVVIEISCQILQPVWSTHFPDVTTSTDVEADSIAHHALPSYDRVGQQFYQQFLRFAPEVGTEPVGEKQGYTLWYLFYQGQFCSGLLETDGSQLLFETVFSAAHFLRQQAVQCVVLRMLTFQSLYFLQNLYVAAVASTIVVFL